MKTILKSIIFFNVVLAVLFFGMFFANIVNAAQNSNFPTPAQCKGANWNIGLPTGTVCSGSVITGGAGGAMENDSVAVNVLGAKSRVKPDVVSLNEFCKQYTKDSTSHAVSGTVFNYCSGCDQKLSWWNGNSWTTNTACAGTLNVQKVVCSTNCQNQNNQNITCNTNSDCGNNGFIGSPFCQSGDVFKKNKTFTCLNPGTVNSTCTSSTEDKLIDNCSANQTCSNGSCVGASSQCSNNLANDFIRAVCSTNSQLCSQIHNISVNIIKASALNLTYEVPHAEEPNHCSSVRLHVSVDGVEKATSEWMGWKENPLAGPFITTISIPTVSQGNHTIGIRGEGKLGGCNIGRLNTWGGPVSITAVQDQCQITCNTNSQCGTDKFIGSPFCQSGSVYQNFIKHTCLNPGTTNSSCSEPIVVSKLKTTCSANQTCSNGSCVNQNITCNTNSDCGTSGFIGSPFCAAGNVFKSFKTFTCLNPGTANSTCSNSTDDRLVTTCSANQTCSNGSCVNQNITCNSNSDCGTNGFIGSPFCAGGNVYKSFTTHTCNNPGTANSRCSVSTDDRLVTTCLYNQTCSNGQCSQQNYQNPIANAGSDQYINNLGQSVVLQGSGYDPNGGNVNFYWSCNGGYLSNPNIAQPTFSVAQVMPYSYNYQNNYNCTLTVTNSFNLSASDSMIVYVNNQQNNNISVQTNSATNISNNSATLNGYLSGYNNSYYGNTNVWFQWGTSTSYGNTTNNQIMYNSGAFSQNIANLSPNTTYHFRAAAQQGNSGVVYGQDTTFYTGSDNVGNLLTVNKTVKNLSSGNLNWSNIINASPSDVLSFMITVQASSSQNVNNVVVRDILPANLIYQNNLVISGSNYNTGYNTSNNAGYNYNTSSDLSSGITFPTIAAGQTVTITYQAQVAPAQNFSYGTTTLNNSVSVSSSQMVNPITGSVTVVVNRTGVLGATYVNTGLTNNPFVDSFFLPLLIALFGVWALKSGIFNFNEWLDSRKMKTIDYRAGKKLKNKIIEIKNREGELWPEL